MLDVFVKPLYLYLLIAFFAAFFFLLPAKIPAVNSHQTTPNMPAKAIKYPLIALESVMSQKAHGTCAKPVMKNLLYGADWKTADRICCFNRHYAEHAGYLSETTWINDVKDKGEVTYYDSVSGKPLFIAPRGRSWASFLKESQAHGWPSFRDEEVVWENVRCLKNGETISLVGTHLGHNLPDKSGNRYCINLVSVAGRPDADQSNL
jgi:peptide methionine sulfoxide reductase MsrB